MRRFIVGLVLVLVSTVLVSSPGRADEGDHAASAAAPDRIDRLVGLAHVWAMAKYFHPAMFQRAIDWDAALVKTIPKVEAATDAESYRAAIESLLATIGDPHTVVTLPAAATKPAAEWKSWATKDVLVLNARLPRDPADGAATRRLVRDAEPELAKAKVVVIDLRGISNEEDAWYSLLDRILDDLPSTSTWPTIRRIRHVGFRSQGETNRDTYATSWDLASAGAPTRGAAAGPSHVVFVADPHETLPRAAVALWMSGHATLVSSGALDENAAATSTRVELPYGLVANVRTSDVLLPGGRAIAADVVTSAADDVRARAIGRDRDRRRRRSAARSRPTREHDRHAPRRR